MDKQFLLVLSIFTGVAALALVVQMFLFLGLYRSIKAIQERLQAFTDRADPLLDSTRRLVEETRTQTRDVFGKVQEIVDATRTQVVRLDELLAEVTKHTRTQLERIDRVAEDACDRVEATVAAVQKTVLAPVREINAVAAAVRAVVGHLGRRRLAAVERPTQDEDLFI
jgi:uncharacterized protein YoxC